MSINYDNIDQSQYVAMINNQTRQPAYNHRLLFCLEAAFDEPRLMQIYRNGIQKLIQHSREGNYMYNLRYRLHDPRDISRWEQNYLRNTVYPAQKIWTWVFEQCQKVEQKGTNYEDLVDELLVEANYQMNDVIYTCRKFNILFDYRYCPQYLNNSYC